MKYKLIEDKNGTIVSNEKRYKMSEYEILHNAKDLIKIDKEIELLHNKIDAQDKIINTQALEIARLKERIEININAFLYQSKKIDKAIEYIKEDMYGEPNELYGLVDGEHILKILGDK